MAEYNRRLSDRRSVQLVGWVACLALAGSLTYAFVSSLREGPETVDPWFFGCQTLASLLFLVYSLRLKNRIFVVANAVAVFNAVGTLMVFLMG